MSERVDAVLAAIDVGLQEFDRSRGSAPGGGEYLDVAAVVDDVCLRCPRPRFEESDFCELCRAFMLGDTDVDPANDGGDVASGWITVEGVPSGDQRVHAPRGGIRYVPPPTRPHDGQDVAIPAVSFDRAAEAFANMAAAFRPIGEAFLHVGRQILDGARAAGIIDEEGQLTEPARSVVAAYTEAQCRRDLAAHGEAFVNERGVRVDPMQVRSGLIIATDPSGQFPTSGPVEYVPATVDADGNPVTRWVPPPTGDPRTDPVAYALAYITSIDEAWDESETVDIAANIDWDILALVVDDMRRDAYLPDGLPLRIHAEPSNDPLCAYLTVEWCSAAISFVTDPATADRFGRIMGLRADAHWCDLCEAGEPLDIQIVRDSSLFERNAVEIYVDHRPGPCTNEGSSDAVVRILGDMAERYRIRHLGL